MLMDILTSYASGYSPLVYALLGFLFTSVKIFLYHATKGYIDANEGFRCNIETGFFYPKAFFCHLLPIIFFTLLSFIAMFDLFADALTGMENGQNLFFPVMAFLTFIIGVVAGIFLGFDIFEDCVSKKYATAVSFLICLLISGVMFFNGHTLTVFVLLLLTILMTVICGMPGLYKSKTEWIIINAYNRGKLIATDELKVLLLHRDDESFASLIQYCVSHGYYELIDTIHEMKTVDRNHVLEELKKRYSDSSFTDLLNGNAAHRSLFIRETLLREISKVY